MISIYVVSCRTNWYVEINLIIDSIRLRLTYILGNAGAPHKRTGTAILSSIYLLANNCNFRSIHKYYVTSNQLLIHGESFTHAFDESFRFVDKSVANIVVKATKAKITICESRTCYIFQYVKDLFSVIECIHEGG